MGTEPRSNCCNARIRVDKDKTICLKCNKEIETAMVHQVEVKSTVHATLQKKPSLRNI